MPWTPVRTNVDNCVKIVIIFAQWLLLTKTSAWVNTGVAFQLIQFNFYFYYFIFYNLEDYKARLWQS